jgi:hypothetical protein
MNKIIQDMIPLKNKSPLREAIPMEREHPRSSPSLRPPRTPRRKNLKTSGGIIGKRTVKPWLFGIIALICVLALIFAFSSVYARATVTIVPTSIDIPVSVSLTAYKDATASGTLPYEVIQTNDSLSQSIPATIGSAITTSAKGIVVLYNDYGTASQKILANTRLSNGNGLVYLTNNSVIIPGTTKNSAGTTVVGSVAVGVTAASGGASYNILPSDLTANPSYGDFSIIAYKGGPKYAGFYARLNPNGAGITGGFSGNQVIVSSSTITTANANMKGALQASLLSKAQALIPAGYVMYANAYSINYTPIAASTTSATTASVGMKASLSGALFKKSDLAMAIAPTQYNNSFDPQDLESAQFTINNPESFSIASGTAMNFSLKGNMNLVGIISTSTLSSQLAGISKAQSNVIFKKYAAISTARATMVPFWKQSFPSSASRITIIINNQ